LGPSPMPSNAPLCLFQSSASLQMYIHQA
jgi:hypothetical protein